MKDYEKAIKQRMRNVDERLDAVQKRMDVEVVKWHNQMTEWSKRRVIMPKRCSITGETIKPLSVAYFKDYWHHETISCTRIWISEEAYTWKTLQDDV